jgi:cytoskeletal protein RodZ
MFGTTGKTSWRLLAAVPFVLLLGIVGIKLTAGDPNSPLNNVPGVQSIYELGEDAPSTDVDAKLPKSPKPSQSTTATTSASASASASATPTPTVTKAAAPTTSTTKPAPVQTSTSSGPKPSPTPTKTTETPAPPRPSTFAECLEAGGQWRLLQQRCEF